MNPIGLLPVGGIMDPLRTVWVPGGEDVAGCGVTGVWS